MSRKETDLPLLADPVTRPYSPYFLDDPGWWLILSDLHFPYHDKTVIEIAVREAQRRKVKGILLNGDVGDFHKISRFETKPDEMRYPEELKIIREFLAYLRSKFPRARIIWKDGNHEERLLSYLVSKAPELFGLDVLEIPHLLNFKRHRVDYVSDRRIVKLGKHLHALHGHEFRTGQSSPVNPSRTYFQKAKADILFGHFHRISEHQEPSILGNVQRAYSTGCCCQLNPLWMPLNLWSNGFAMVCLGPAGDYSVDNLQVTDGKIL